MLQISEERIKHMHSVAELMFKNAEEFEIEDSRKMYFLGLVHDIGYVGGGESHEKLGAEICSEDHLISLCILWHSSTPSEYKKANICQDDDIPKELILLWWADMQVMANKEQAGEIVSFDERLQDIAKRHGTESHAYKSCAETIEWLKNNGYDSAVG